MSVLRECSEQMEPILLGNIQRQGAREKLQTNYRTNEVVLAMITDTCTENGGHSWGQTLGCSFALVVAKLNLNKSWLEKECRALGEWRLSEKGIDCTDLGDGVLVEWWDIPENGQESIHFRLFFTHFRSIVQWILIWIHSEANNHRPLVVDIR